MKPILKFAAYILLIADALFFSACKKEKQNSTSINPTPNPISSNKPPVANAGSEQTVFLPQDTVVLNGTLSYDPDGRIIKYFWSKLSGPAILGPINIDHADSPVLTIKFIAIGEYIFQLEVTDNAGAISKTTVKVIVKDNPAPKHSVKAKVLEYGTDLPISGATLQVCTSLNSSNNCVGNYLSLTTDANGECFFQANQFRYGWVEKTGYFNNGLLTPCFITYFKNGIQLPTDIDGDMAGSDSFIIKVVPKINFTLHVRDSSGRSSGTNISLVGDVSFGCVSSSGIIGASLRPGIDTTFQLGNYWGNTNYILRVGKNYDSDCGCFETEFYNKTIYLANGNNVVLNITY